LIKAEPKQALIKVEEIPCSQKHFPYFAVTKKTIKNVKNSKFERKKVGKTLDQTSLEPTISCSADSSIPPINKSNAIMSPHNAGHDRSIESFLIHSNKGRNSS
jgi:hypothetical protein